MQAFANGDAKAFEVLYARHKTPVFRFFMRQGLPRSRAEELFQDLWLSIIQAKESYQVSAKFETYLFQIARNKLIDEFRTDKSAKHEDYEDGRHEQSSPESESVISFDGPQVLQCVSALPFEQRQSFLFKYQCGLTARDIAAITEVSIEATKSRLRYALKLLKKCLGVDDEST